MEDEVRRKVNGYYVLQPALSRVDDVSGDEMPVTVLVSSSDTLRKFERDKCRARGTLDLDKGESELLGKLVLKSRRIGTRQTIIYMLTLKQLVLRTSNS